MSNASKANRFFVPELGDSIIELPAGEAHHAIHVLRLRSGDEVELFDGAGTLADGRIQAVSRKCVSVLVDRADRVVRPANGRIELAFAVPKGKRLDWLLEKATELGAAQLQPVIFQRSVAGPAELDGGRMDKWLGCCIAAAKQCGADFLPAINQPQRLETLLHRTRPGLSILGDAGDGAESLGQVISDARCEYLRILVGPEGGLTTEEHGLAVAAGFVPVRLGGNILRTETAAVALLAAAMALLSE